MAAIAAGVGLTAVAAWLAASASSSEHAWLEALARASMVGVPIAVGVYALDRPPFRRSGVLLIGAGGAWFLTTLSEAADPLPYSIGRVAGWLVEVALLYIVLSFPTGRLPARVDRALVAGLALVVALLYLPTALLVEQYPLPSPWTSCVTDCPDNAFRLVDSSPAVVDDVLRPLRELLSAAIFLAAAARLGRRMLRAGRITRRTLAPVLAVALALLTGLISWRLFVARALQHLVADLPARARPEDLRAALADAFEDPELEIVYRIEDHWADADGRRVPPPEPGAGRRMTVAYDGDRKIAAIVHDAALAEDRAFVDAATSYAVITLDTHRLSAETAALLRAVAESRMRIQAGADDERRRVEHGLHQGAQQRLTALRIKLELAAEQMDAGVRSGDPALLRALIAEVDAALDEISALARGIFPAALDRGVVEALRSAALQGALPTTVMATGVRRYSREIESAVYFSCLEALQNAAKHATGATSAVVDLSDDDGVLRLEVRDDGPGYDVEHTAEGVGLTSMRDRVSAVGGDFEVRSRRGRGTHVIATIPVSGAGPAPRTGSPDAP